ncbi:phage tail protein I [Veronia nyctiphanis]|uniref:Phage tail protein I n=1 Tax=Veronia nyctiphanis TaxID=1278244 RepID=A0A4Q0Y8W8_9GAMM|nr:phage tail protein I [Veronia nyctiphanis]RXJ66373.1 phage tail protein I [Veronia nyctiphanis]
MAGVSLSVDDWDPNWPEAQQRQAIKDAARLHRSKGTVGAVKRVLANLGVTVDMLEWFQETDDVALASIQSKTPHTFVFIAWANANPYVSNQVFLSPDLYAAITRAVENTKPLRSHFDFLVGARLDSGLAAGASSGGWLQSGRFSQQTKPVQVPKTISTLSAGFHLTNRRLAVARYYMVESPGVAE